MLDQNIFMETVQSVKEIAKTQAEPMSREEILSYFKDMELTEAHKEMIYQFFLQPEEETQEEKEVREQAEQEAEADNSNNIETENDPDSVFFKMYLEDIQALPVYTQAQEKELYGQLAAGDDQAINKLIECWMKRVLDIARKNRARKVNLEDIIQEGNMGLFLKLQEMCGDSSVTSPEESIEQAVEEAMKAYISEITGEDDSENTILGKATLVHEASKYLKEELGHEPSVEELADYTKMDKEELADIMDMVKENKGGTV